MQMNLEKGRFYLSSRAGLVTVGEKFEGTLVLHSITFGSEVVDVGGEGLRKYGGFEEIPEYRARELVAGLGEIDFDDIENIL